jgi:hypothetical protein
MFHGHDAVILGVATAISIVVMLMQLVCFVADANGGNDNVAAYVVSAGDVVVDADYGVPYFDVGVADVLVAFAITHPLAIVSIAAAFVVSASAR